MSLAQSIVNKSIIKVKSPKAKSTFELHNPRQQAVTIIEPELLFQYGERCDYVFQISTHPLELYVELKGSKLEKALNQLSNTMRLMNSAIIPKKCYVVIWQGSPPNANTKAQNLKLSFERTHKCKLEWKTEHGYLHLK